jgi:hypothetical protein
VSELTEAELTEISDLWSRQRAIEEQPRRRGPREQPRWRPPNELVDGLEEVNRLRYRATGLDRPERRELTVIDALWALDAECDYALAEWADAIAAHKTAVTEWKGEIVAHKSQPFALLRLGLSPDAALLLGALRELSAYPPQSDDGDYQVGTQAAPLLLRTRLTLPRDLARFVHALADSPTWQARIRHCPWCLELFLDRSPKGNAVACKLEHGVRLAEDWHQAEATTKDNKLRFVLPPRKRRGVP